MYIEPDGKHILKLYITSIQNQDAGTFSCRGTVSGSTIEEFVTLLIYSQFTLLTHNLCYEMFGKFVVGVLMLCVIMRV